MEQEMADIDAEENGSVLFWMLSTFSVLTLIAFFVIMRQKLIRLSGLIKAAFKSVFKDDACNPVMVLNLDPDESENDTQYLLNKSDPSLPTEPSACKAIEKYAVPDHQKKLDQLIYATKILPKDIFSAQDGNSNGPIKQKQSNGAIDENIVNMIMKVTEQEPNHEPYDPTRGNAYSAKPSTKPSREARNAVMEKMNNKQNPQSFAGRQTERHVMPGYKMQPNLLINSKQNVSNNLYARDSVPNYAAMKPKTANNGPDKFLINVSKDDTKFQPLIHPKSKAAPNQQNRSSKVISKPAANNYMAPSYSQADSLAERYNIPKHKLRTQPMMFFSRNDPEELYNRAPMRSRINGNVAKLPKKNVTKEPNCEPPRQAKGKTVIQKSPAMSSSPAYQENYFTTHPPQLYVNNNNVGDYNWPKSNQLNYGSEKIAEGKAIPNIAGKNNGSNEQNLTGNGLDLDLSDLLVQISTEEAKCGSNKMQRRLPAAPKPSNSLPTEIQRAIKENIDQLAPSQQSIENLNERYKVPEHQRKLNELMYAPKTGSAKIWTPRDSMIPKMSNNALDKSGMNLIMNVTTAKDIIQFPRGKTITSKVHRMLSEQAANDSV